MNQSFEFNNLPCEIKNIIFQKNRDVATKRHRYWHRRHTHIIRNELFSILDLYDRWLQFGEIFRPRIQGQRLNRDRGYKLWGNLYRNSIRHPQYTKSQLYDIQWCYSRGIVWGF